MKKPQTPWQRSINSRGKVVVPIMVGILVASIAFDWSIPLLTLGFVPILGLFAFMVAKPKTIAITAIAGLLATSAHAMFVPKIDGLTASEQSRYEQAVQNFASQLIATNAPPGEYPIKVDVGNGKTANAVLFIALAVGVVVAYLGNYAYKAYQAGKNQVETRRKQIEKGITNCLAAASFTYTGSSVADDVSPRGNFCFNFIMGGGITNCYIGSPDVTMDEYLTGFGLSTTGNSRSGDPSIGITHEGNTFTVSVPFLQNARVTVQRSEDMVTWTEVGALEAPKWSPVNFEDAEVSTSHPWMFYQLLYD